MSIHSLYYVGLDVHKKSISFCIKDEGGTIHREGRMASTRCQLDGWCQQMERPWIGALEATMFTEWIYDHLREQAVELQVAHPARVKALIAGKKKNDRIDARTLADLLRCNLLPTVHMLPPRLRELRRMLRYRNLLVGQTTRLKNKISGLLMQTGVEYNKSRLHGQRYFQQLIGSLEAVPDSVVGLLRMSRHSLDFLKALERKLLRTLLEDEPLRQRVELLRSIPAVGVIVALTWALEIGEVSRFRTISQALSYCGLTSRQNESAGVKKRGPLSRQRNKHLQSVLVEAAKLAPRYHPELERVHHRERQKGNHNRATLAVARKLVAYLMAVDRRQQPFRVDPVVT
jgi:transposase